MLTVECDGCERGEADNPVPHAPDDIQFRSFLPTGWFYRYCTVQMAEEHRGRIFGRLRQSIMLVACSKLCCQRALVRAKNRFIDLKTGSAGKGYNRWLGGPRVP